MMKPDEVRASLGAGPPSGLYPVVIFIPSLDRVGQPIDQAQWRDSALATLATQFRGATALPPGRGAWNDPETGEVILEDTALVFSIADPNAVTTESLRHVGEFAREMGRETNQGEVGLVVGDAYHPITDF